MTGGDQLIACHIPGDLGICLGVMLNSDGSTFEPLTVFGRGTEQFKSLQSRESCADIKSASVFKHFSFQRFLHLRNLLKLIKTRKPGNLETSL